MPIHEGHGVSGSPGKPSLISPSPLLPCPWTLPTSPGCLFLLVAFLPSRPAWSALQHTAWLPLEGQQACTILVSVCVCVCMSVNVYCCPHVIPSTKLGMEEEKGGEGRARKNTDNYELRIKVAAFCAKTSSSPLPSPFPSPNCQVAARTPSRRSSNFAI